MAEIKIKASMEWKCPHCGLYGKGTLSMNGQCMDWMDRAWKGHIDECRAKGTQTKG